MIFQKITFRQGCHRLHVSSAFHYRNFFCACRNIRFRQRIINRYVFLQICLQQFIGPDLIRFTFVLALSGPFWEKYIENKHYPLKTFKKLLIHYGYLFYRQ